jgi:hypothetical protein
MKSRNPDGRFRNHNQPAVLADHTLRARWLEGEVLRLRRLAFSFEDIAQQVTEVGRGQRAPLTPLPEDLSFPPNYSITPMGCHRALSRALKRHPTARGRRTASARYRPVRRHVSFSLSRHPAGRSAVSARRRSSASAEGRDQRLQVLRDGAKGIAGARLVFSHQQGPDRGSLQGSDGSAHRPRHQDRRDETRRRPGTSRHRG